MSLAGYHISHRQMKPWKRFLLDDEFLKELKKNLIRVMALVLLFVLKKSIIMNLLNLHIVRQMLHFRKSIWQTLIVESFLKVPTDTHLSNPYLGVRTCSSDYAVTHMRNINHTHSRKNIFNIVFSAPYGTGLKGKY